MHMLVFIHNYAVTYALAQLSSWQSKFAPNLPLCSVSQFVSIHALVIFSKIIHVFLKNAVGNFKLSGEHIETSDSEISDHEIITNVHF